MSNRFRHTTPAFLQLATVLLTASPCFAAWQSNFAFGTTLSADLYTPSTVAASPAVLVAIHYCGGNAAKAHGWFDSYADKNGFYIIAPDAGKNCFDSSATRAGDREAIVKMVQYLITNKNADKSRVFAAGFSSGGCMTNTLLAIYPDVFAGGSAMPGFPAGAWPAGDTTCSKCCQSNCPKVNTDGKYWADIARTAFSFSGTRPCVQEWVGDADEYHFNDWLPAVAAQFQELGGLGSGTAGTGAPSGWTRTVYKDTAGNVRLETNTKSGQKHDLTGANLGSSVISFLGLDKPTGSCGITSGTGGTGGATSTNGGTSNAGGKSSSGGASNIGGKSGNTGGKSNTGGATANSGGKSSTATKSTSTSVISNGGTTSNGGTSSTGGASVLIVSAPAGGASVVGLGGTPTNVVTSASTLTNTGGATTAANNGSSTDVAGNPTDDGGGCACNVPGGRRPLGGAVGLFFLGIVMLLVRRRNNVT